MKIKEILRFVLPVLVVFMILASSDVQVSKMTTPTNPLVNEKPITNFIFCIDFFLFRHFK